MADLSNWDECQNDNWLLGTIWTITPYAQVDGAYTAFNVLSSGKVGRNATFTPINVQPVVYLKSTVKIISGNGSSLDPFRLSL